MGSKSKVLEIVNKPQQDIFLGNRNIEFVISSWGLQCGCKSAYFIGSLILNQQLHNLILAFPHLLIRVGKEVNVLPVKGGIFIVALSVQVMAYLSFN